MALMLAVVLGSPVSTQAAEKTYVIGTDVTYAPFEFADKNNQYVGIDIDLMQAIAKAEGFKVDIKPLGFNAAVQALEANQIDGVIAGMQITPERQQKFAMSDPYYKTAVAMAVGQNSEVKSLKDLRGKRVAGSCRLCFKFEGKVWFYHGDLRWFQQYVSGCHHWQFGRLFWW